MRFHTALVGGIALASLPRASSVMPPGLRSASRSALFDSLAR